MKWLSRLAKLLVLTLAAFGLWTLWPASEPPVEVYHATDFTAAPDGVVGFPSFNARTAVELESGGKGSVSQTSGGLLVLPPGANADNPVPAVVILHGSGR